MTARMVDRRLARLHAALQGKAAPDVELEAAHQFQRTTNRIAAAIAREIAIPEKTVQDWGNVNSGDRGPHLTLLYITQLAIEMRPLKKDRHECFAALDFVERELGRVALELPSNDVALTPESRAAAIANAVVELGEYVSLVSGRPTMKQKLRLAQEFSDVVAALQALMPTEDGE